MAPGFVPKAGFLASDDTEGLKWLGSVWAIGCTKQVKGASWTHSAAS